MTIDDIVVPFTSESLQLTLREFDLLMQIALGGWVWEEPTFNRAALFCIFSFFFFLAWQAVSR